MLKRKLVGRMTEAVTGSAPRVLIVGTGLTGSLTCYHLRQRCGLSLRIDVADMARGAGGRMSTTRWGNDDIRANTGAQYLSCCSEEASALLQTVCGSSGSCPIDLVEEPLERSTHFVLQPEAAYSHWLPRGGTNTAVKQFLHAARPDNLAFESRLQALTESPRGHLAPNFDRGGAFESTYDVVLLAMPPKDIIRFFSNGVFHQDSQSQADLHRRTNRSSGRGLPQGHRLISLPSEVMAQLRTPAYNGRYSLALWMRDVQFIEAVSSGWRLVQGAHPVIDLVSAQPGGVLVVQSTVELWRSVEGAGKGKGRRGKGKGKGKGARLDGIQGGGRDAARAHMVRALEQLAGSKMPQPQHTKLLNWRTSQASPPLTPEGGGIVTAEGGRLIFTGDWCVESSFEGCNLAAQMAAEAAADAVSGATAVNGAAGINGGVEDANDTNHTTSVDHEPGQHQFKGPRNRKLKANRVQR